MKYEWQECTIGDLGQIVTGKTPPTKNNEYWGGKVMFITPKDIQAAKHIFKTERYVTGQGKVAVRGAILPKGSICVSCIGNIGYLGITTEECISNQQINSIIVNENNDVDFVYYLLKSLWAYFKNYEGQSTALSILNKTQFSKIKVQIPNIEVQKKISGVLKMLDEKIELNNAINNNLQEQARALYRSWFVDFEPFDGSKPSNWKNGRLKDVLSLQRSSIKAGENTSLPYLPIDIIPMNTFGLSDVKPNEEAQSSLITFSKDDIVIGAMRVYFHRVIIAPFDGITRTTCFTLRPFNADYLGFSLLCCDQDSSIEYAQQTSKGSTMPYAVWDGGLGDMEIPIPDPKTAHRFNEIVMPMIRIIQSSFAENKNLRELRDALLPRLMSGELDVSDLDL